jgi:hypothetical protein
VKDSKSSAPIEPPDAQGKFPLLAALLDFPATRIIFPAKPQPPV